MHIIESEYPSLLSCSKTFSLSLCLSLPVSLSHSRSLSLFLSLTHDETFFFLSLTHDETYTSVPAKEELLLIPQEASTNTVRIRYYTTLIPLGAATKP